jgi:N,N-dimethylformamidase
MAEGMLIGYVSDERYVALADVLVEFDQEGRTVALARSTARGAVYADIAPGRYRATLVKPGFGSKHTLLDVAPGQPPHQFRLLSDRLYGYVWPKWVRAGARSEFRVSSVEPYRLSLWRYGYRKEFVKLIGWYDEHGPRAVMQITPDGDYTQTGVRWNTIGYGNPDLTQFATAPERSGLYYFHAKTEGGEFFSFPWVVAPAAPAAPIAVLASTGTWNAYNNFGGRSNYINARGLPEEPVVNARQDMLRYQRESGFTEWGVTDDQYPPLTMERPEPFNVVPEETEIMDPIAGRQPNHLAPAEWRLLGWLEREGFAYDFYAEYQLHTGEMDLDAYRVLIIDTHPEYWSRAMYDRVKRWVYERGGRLIYLGGNGLDCEVEYLDDATMRFKTYWPGAVGVAGRIDPNDPNRYMESRFDRTAESQAHLLGVVLTHTGIMTAAPYRVRDADHWVFTGTGLKDGDLFGAASQHERVPGGASGHETDKMSAASPPNTALLAKGTNPDEGGAEMVYYDVPQGGGAVFSVGSITYPSSLLMDPHISRITLNVLTRFLSNE